MLARLTSATQNPAVSFTHGNTHSDLTDYEGEQLTFSATATPGAGAAIAGYEWDFDGDGTFDATGPQPKHTYPAAGSYVAQLRVTDSDGVRGYASRTISVAANAGPAITALSASPLHPANGGTVALCPQGSDPKGYSVSYELDLDGDGTFETPWSGSGACPTTGFDTSGAKPATKTYAARAIDFVGKRSAALTKTVQGVTSAPAAGVVISDKNVVAVGQAITFVAQNFADIDGVVSQWRFDLDGNGTWDTPWQTSASYKTTFASPRQASVRAQGMDEDGEVSPATLGHGYAVVGPPTATFTVKAAKASTSKGRPKGGIHPLQKLSFDASASKPGPFAPFLAPIGFVSYSWDPQGDGSFISSTGAVLDGVAYADPGVYQAKLTICTAALVDQCTSAIKKVTIVNKAPQADFGLETGGQLKYQGKPFTVEAGRLAHFQATVAKDPDGPPHKVVSYEWDLDANAAVVSQPGARAASNGKNIPPKPSGVLPGQAALSSKPVSVATAPVGIPGFTVNAKGPGPTVKFLQASDGVYHVALRETDDSGGATTVVHPVKVTKPTPPLAHFSIDFQYSQDALGVPILRPGIGYPLHSDSSASPSASKPGLTYDWSNGCKGDAQGCSVSFPKPGGYVIALTVTDADGISALYSQPVIVRDNTAPFGTVKVTPAYPRGGVPVHLDATGSTDDGKYFSLDWGHFNDPVFITDYDSHDFGLDVKLYEGHHDLALRLTDDEGQNSVVEVPIDVGPPTCQSTYVSDRLAVAVDDASTGCIRVHEGVGAVTGKPETHVEIGGPFTVDGLHVDPAGTAQIFDFHNAIANDKVEAKFPGVYKAGDKLPIVIGGAGQVRRGSFVVSDGKFGFAVRPDGGLDFLSYAPKVAQKLHGLEVVGITGQQVTAASKVDFGINIKLPDQVGGTTSDNTPFSAWAQENGGGGTRRAHGRDTGVSTDCSGIPGAPPGATCITVETGDLADGALSLRKLQLAYGGNDVWIVRAEGSLPIPPNGADVAAGVRIENGGFKHGDLAADFKPPGFPVAEAVNLTHVDFAIDVSDGFSFVGNANFVVGPSFDDDGDALLGLNAQMTFKFPKQGYWTIGGGGEALLLGRKVGDGSFLYSSSGYVEFGGSLKYSPTPATSFEGHVAGQYYDGQFNLSGGGQGCVLGWCEGGHGVISSKGIGVCIDVTVSYLVGSVTWSPGFSVAYHPFDLDLFAHACDLSDVTVTIVQPTRRRSAFVRGAPGDLPVYAHAAGFSKTFELKKDLPGAVLAVVGSTAPPQITLAGPKSRKIVGTPSGLVVRKKDYTLLHDPKTKTTYVVLLGPPKGKWTVSVPEGSSPVLSATLTPGLAEPSVTAKVSKVQGEYQLDYKVLDQPGLQVEFAERSGKTFASLGTVKPGVGTLKFRPAAGPKGSRDIVAILTTDGRPRSQSVVGQYDAPAPSRPGDVSGVKVVIKNGKAGVSWDKAARAGRYFVTVRLSDGRVVRASVKKTSFSVDGLDRGVDAAATVQAFDAQGLRGDADKDKASTPGLPAKLAFGLAQTIKEIDKATPAPAPGLTLLPSTTVPVK
ncbi:MAG: PKD domain-containing protein [Solirubrobacteraceae bacterium]